jgi:hypothetical protein
MAGLAGAAATAGVAVAVPVMAGPATLPALFLLVARLRVALGNVSVSALLGASSWGAARR